MAISPKKNLAVDVANTDGVYSNIRYNATLHKALDFSNIGIPNGTINGADAGNAKFLRQFHQTRIFIQARNNFAMHHHTERQNYNTTYLISANLPQKVSYGIESQWEKPLGALSTQFNALMQLGTSIAADQGWLKQGVSGVNKATTFYIWSGSKNFNMQLDIPVIDDNYGTHRVGDIATNLTEALEFLGSLVLPSYANGAGFYLPPPSPLGGTITLSKDTKFTINNPTHCRIMVQLGGILLIDNCIVTSVRVEYPNTKTQILHYYPSGIEPGSSGRAYLAPLLATVHINLMTIDSLTAQTYSKMLWLKQQDETGNMSANVEELIKAAGQSVNAIWNSAKNAFSNNGQEQGG